jgi:hypothetical protein
MSKRDRARLRREARPDRATRDAWRRANARWVWAFLVVLGLLSVVCAIGIANGGYPPLTPGRGGRP